MDWTNEDWASHGQDEVIAALEGMPTRTQKVIEAMGGIDAFMPPDKKYFEMERFEQTYETMLRKNPIGLPGSTAGQRQITE